MSYKDINEKYRKILEEDSKRRQKEEKELTENLQMKKDKRVTQEYNSRKKEVEKLIKEIQAKLSKHSKGDISWAHVGDLGKIKQDLENIVRFINP